MQLTPIDVSRWSKRNLWRLPSGELAVRPGLRRLVDTSGTSKLIAPGAFTIRNDFSGGEVWHYFVTYKDNSTNAKAPQLFIVDENFATVQSLTINSNRAPRVVTYGVVQGQVMICSPDFPPITALVGSGAKFATKVDSDDTTVTAIPLPSSCICTSWVGSRIVYASGRSVFVSDPVTALGGSPRTIVDENQCELPGVIYGIHEAAGGMLVAVTDAGVYGLDSAAASVGIIGDGGADWRLLNHHKVSNYGASCVVRGRVYALTLRGFMLVDVENDDETNLNEPMMSIAIGAGRYAMDDFRAARIIAGEDGPIVGCDDLGAVVMTDLTVNPPIISWWKTADFSSSTNYGQSSFGGVLQDVDGTPLYVGSHGIYRLTGDFDGTQLLSSFSTWHTGSIRGVIANEPAGNARVRHVHVAAANGGGTPTIQAASRGVAHSTVNTPDDAGIVIGTDAWGTTTKHYTVTPLSSARFDFGDAPENDLSFEIAADAGLVRISTKVDVDFGDSATKRPSKVG